MFIMPILKKGYKYDLGKLGQSPYFQDANEGCYEEIEHTFCDCAGELVCYVENRELPYIPKHPLLPPLFVDSTFGAVTYFKAKIKDKAYIAKELLWIQINRPLLVGDIIKTKSDCMGLYYIKERLKKRDKNGNFVVSLQRLDGKEISITDKLKFKRDTTIFVTGYLK